MAIQLKVVEFQSTLPQGERRICGDLVHSVYKFQSTLPQGERPERTDGNRSRMKISIHAPARGATRKVRKDTRRMLFQSTLPQGERPNAAREFTGYEFISIHAPARGATRNRRDIIAFSRHISIHAPARGATMAIEKDFDNNNISIHAPARGATRLVRLQQLMHLYFNPRSRKGSDIEYYNALTKALQFQSTLPQGERHTTKKELLCIQVFQSTLPQGERPS